MTAFNVKYKLYDSTGSSLIYTFPLVQRDNSPQDPKDFVEISGLRGIGSLIIPGSTEAWDLVMEFILSGVDYSNLIAQMDALQTTILPLTRYVLKIDRTSSTSQSYNVMRLNSFQFSSEDFRTNFVNVVINLRVNSWS